MEPQNLQFDPVDLSLIAASLKNINLCLQIFSAFSLTMGKAPHLQKQTFLPCAIITVCHASKINDFGTFNTFMNFCRCICGQAQELSLYPYSNIKISIFLNPEVCESKWFYKAAPLTSQSILNI